MGSFGKPLLLGLQHRPISLLLGRIDEQLSMARSIFRFLKFVRLCAFNRVIRSAKRKARIALGGPAGGCHWQCWQCQALAACDATGCCSDFLSLVG